MVFVCLIYAPMNIDNMIMHKIQAIFLSPNTQTLASQSDSFASNNSTNNVMKVRYILFSMLNVLINSSSAEASKYLGYDSNVTICHFLNNSSITIDPNRLMTIPLKYTIVRLNHILSPHQIITRQQRLYHAEQSFWD